MPLMSKPASEAKIALLFVTLGSVMLVWSGVWYLYQHNQEGAGTPPWEEYTCYGSLGTGAVLLIIGLAVGRIARAARQAEMPPEEITHAEGQIAHEAASRAPIVTPVGIGGAAVTGANGAALGVNPAATTGMNPAAPVARAVAAYPPNPPNPTANSTPTATF